MLHYTIVGALPGLCVDTVLALRAGARPESREESTTPSRTAPIAYMRRAGGEAGDMISAEPGSPQGTEERTVIARKWY